MNEGHSHTSRPRRSSRRLRRQGHEGRTSRATKTSATRTPTKLKLILNNGQTQHIWIDSKTFLEAKIEGTPRRLDGKLRNVATYPRDYRVVNGLMIPHLMENIVEGYRERSEKIQIDTVVVNPQLEESTFAKLK